MSIGERRHRVTFQRATIVADDFGEPDKSWSDICTSYALVQPLRGKEMFSANQQQSEIDNRIVVRNRPELESLSSGDRAIWNGHTYDIRAVLWRDHRAAELEIMAKEHF